MKNLERPKGKGKSDTEVIAFEKQLEKLTKAVPEYFKVNAKISKAIEKESARPIQLSWLSE